MDSITKVKDLIKSLSQYDQELNIIFCDSSYSSIDYEDCEIDRNLVIGKYVTMCYGFYDRNIDSVIPLECADSKINCLELSIQYFQLEH